MLYFSIQNASPRWYESGLRSGGCEITSLSSDIFGYPRIVFISAETIQGCHAEILPSGFRGRRSIWCSWRVTLVAQRILNDVS